jgi:hypothetical protein
MSVARAVLAAVALGWILFGATEVLKSPPFYVLGLYLGCAVLLAVRARPPRGIYGMLALMADIVYLLVAAYYGGERMIWFSSVFLLYALGEALVFFGVAEVAVVTAVAGAFCVALPSLALDPLLRTIAAAGTVALGAAIYKRRMTALVAGLETRAAEARLPGRHGGTARAAIGSGGTDTRPAHLPERDAAG